MAHRVVGCSESALQQLSAVDLNVFLSTGFRAADPTLQDHCVAVMRGLGAADAQFRQDVFLWRNFFAHMTLRGEKGFYVDSGANEPRNISNTFFFDRCLGWPGLCVEPNEEYHAAIATQRSCTLIKECITAKPSRLHMQLKAGLSKVTRNKRAKPVHCNPLESMLHRAPGWTGQVSLWSLDVEGHEMVVLNGTRFDVTPTDVLLVEDNNIASRPLDRLMAQKGFLKAAQLPIDSVYVARRRDVCWPESYWEIPEEAIRWEKQSRHDAKKKYFW